MLIDIDNAVVTQVTNLFTTLDLNNYSNKIGLTLVDDEHSHIRQIEALAREAGIETEALPNRRFPAALVLRKDINSRVNTVTSSKAAIQDIMISQDSFNGAAVLCDAKQVTLEYAIVQYATNFAELSKVVEYWFLNAGIHYTSMIFSFSEPELSPLTFEGNIQFDEPSSVRPTITEVEQTGSVYIQYFPFKLATVLIGNIRTSNELILTTELNINILRQDELFPTRGPP